MDKLLPEFQKYLLDHKLAPEKQISFLAFWVSKFLHFAGRKGFDAVQHNETAVTEYIEQLHADQRTTDWQTRQAHDAITLYYFHYLGQKRSGPQPGAADTDFPAILTEARRLIRLKHYSYSTERTYLQWIERFIAYAMKTGKKTRPDELDTEDLKNFLSHLALQKVVSSSTQNQSFNALLFLFRHVLGKETAGLGDTVRAKRGQKLPASLRPVGRPAQREDKETPYQRYRDTECNQERHEKSGHRETCLSAHPPSQFCNSPSSGGRQHQGGPGPAGT